MPGTRVIPLVIDQKKLDEAKKLLDGHKIIEVKPMKSFNIGIVTTGSEVYYHRIKDKFGPIPQRQNGRLSLYGCRSDLCAG